MDIKTKEELLFILDQVSVCSFLTQLSFSSLTNIYVFNQPAEAGMISITMCQSLYLSMNRDGKGKSSQLTCVCVCVCVCVCARACVHADTHVRVCACVIPAAHFPPILHPLSNSFPNIDLLCSIWKLQPPTLWQPTRTECHNLPVCHRWIIFQPINLTVPSCYNT